MNIKIYLPNALYVWNNGSTLVINVKTITFKNCVIASSIFEVSKNYKSTFFSFYSLYEYVYKV